MSHDPLDEVELTALVVSLRQLVDTFLVRLPDAVPMPPRTDPFDVRAEVQAVHDMLKALCRSASDDEIEAQRARALPAGEGETPHNARVRRAEVRFYTNILVDRGAMKPSLNKPKAETTEIHALGLRMVVASFLLNLPDDDIIQANRQVYHQHQAFKPVDGDENDETIQLSMVHFMDFLQKFMDSSGITDRYLARMPSKGSVH